MEKLQRPLAELQQEYSMQLNHGREMLVRHVTRSSEYSDLVRDAEQWDDANVRLVQSTFLGDTPEYSPLPPLMSKGDIGEDLRILRRDLTANIDQLEAIKDRLQARKSGGCGTAAVFLLSLPLLGLLVLAALR
jgi:hypothetical protein